MQIAVKMSELKEGFDFAGVGLDLSLFRSEELKACTSGSAVAKLLG